MKRRTPDLHALPADTLGQLDDRLHSASGIRKLLNKVFPDHWSFLLGELALWSFVILLLTGTYLSFFFDPSMEEVRYDGSYLPLRGVSMSKAYASSMDISFDVRGGLIIRQMHHWAALLFMAAIIIHMCRVFFTGAFRKPRELNWIIGLSLFWIGFTEGFAGYSLPDDGLSGTGLRIASAIMLSIPVVGSWVTTAIFGGEFPGTDIIPRLYIVHVLLIPAILVALISAHLALMVLQKHTQWPGPGRTNDNVVGERAYPRYAIKMTGFFMIAFGVTAVMGGLFQINPIWLFGPYKAGAVSSASQPDWYVLFLEGSTRLFPAWEIRVGGYTVPGIFWPAVVLPGILTVLPMIYPFLEARFTKDRQLHHLLQRPRDVPTRTGLGAMAITFYLVLTLSGGNDVIADKFHVSLNATTWAGRIGLIVAPPLAYYLAHRACLGLQQHDREVLAHGIETGVIRRLPDGRFIEVHQPLGPVDGHGHGELEYTGWVVPKKMNRVGALGPAIKGFFFPIEKAPRVPVSPAPQLPPTESERKEIEARR
jgi:quinol---cytochrome-c reductase cytochrome b subunit